MRGALSGEAVDHAAGEIVIDAEQAIDIGARKLPAAAKPWA